MAQVKLPKKKSTVVDRKFIYDPPKLFFNEFEQLEFDARLELVVKAFKENLASVFSVGKVPYYLVKSSLVHADWDRHFLAEKIRALKVTDGSKKQITDKKKQNTELSERTNLKFSAEVFKPDYRKALFNRINKQLSFAIQTEEFDGASEELLRQVWVIAWSAFEVLTKDLIQEVINAKPALVIDFFKKEKNQDRYGKISTAKMFEQYGFDLSKKMGRVFCDHVKIDSLNDIKNVCKIIYESNELETELKNNDLYLLFHKRNLIVHRRGIIDQEFLNSTNSTDKIGKKIIISSYDVIKAASVVREVGLKMVEVATSKIK